MTTKPKATVTGGRDVPDARIEFNVASGVEGGETPEEAITAWRAKFDALSKEAWNASQALSDYTSKKDLDFLSFFPTGSPARADLVNKLKSGKISLAGSREREGSTSTERQLIRLLEKTQDVEQRQTDAWRTGQELMEQLYGPDWKDDPALGGTRKLWPGAPERSHLSKEGPLRSEEALESYWTEHEGKLEKK
tara:strand:+ start:743 stop:1321 length:579 start_codon:yes stop_codon:yes gene_type:complete